MNCEFLPMTPFERYMLADDRPQYPMTFFMQFDFDGDVQRDCWEQAYREVVSRHPLLNARVENGRWRAAGEESPEHHWQDFGEPVEPEGGERIDLTGRTGLRAWTQIGTGRVRLVCQFHHACCDGVGALQFIGDWLAAYRRLCGCAEDETGELDVARLASRGDPRWRVVEDVEPVPRWKAIWSFVQEAVRFASRRPQPVRFSRPRPTDDSIGATVAEEQPENAGHPQWHHHSLSPETTRRLRRQAKTLGVTVNDLMVRDLFLMLADWNRSQQEQSERGWLQINVPTNLRSRVDNQLPAANIIGYAFLGRRQDECQEAGAETLLQGITRDMAAIRKWNLGQYFLDGLARAQRLPGMMRWFTRPRCRATAVFSNLGDPSRRFRQRLPRKQGLIVVGDLTLRRVLAVPPLRPLTRVAMLAVHYGGELTLVLQADRRLVRPKTASELLEHFVARLEATSEPPETPDSTPHESPDKPHVSSP